MSRSMVTSKVYIKMAKEKKIDESIEQKFNKKKMLVEWKNDCSPSSLLTIDWDIGSR